MDSIVQFAQTNFDWDVSKTKSKLAPILKKVSERTVSFLNILIIYLYYLHIVIFLYMMYFTI